ncbi:MAG: hypothetical protein HZC24_12660 [Rhodocyclales bacterium]|nr:hypothetical protein [Rhodocyclales bacterium]
MKSATGSTPASIFGSQQFAVPFGLMLDQWAEASKHYLTAAEEICRQGTAFCQTQTEDWREIAAAPNGAATAQKCASLINHNVEAASEMTRTCMESISRMQEPVLKLVEAQLPALSKTLLDGMEEFARSGTQRAAAKEARGPAQRAA